MVQAGAESRAGLGVGLGSGPGGEEVTAADDGRRSRDDPDRLGRGRGPIREKAAIGAGVGSAGIGSWQSAGGAPSVFRQEQVPSTHCVNMQQVQPTRPQTQPLSSCTEPESISHSSVMDMVTKQQPAPTTALKEKHTMEMATQTPRQTLYTVIHSSSQVQLSTPIIADINNGM